MSKLENGYHTVAGYYCYIDNGMIRRILVKGDNGYVACYPYRKSPYGGWYQDVPISPSAFRAGIKRGTVTVR